MAKISELMDDMIVVWTRIKKRPRATLGVLIAILCVSAGLIWLKSYLGEHAKSVAAPAKTDTTSEPETQVSDTVVIDDVIVHSKGRGVFEIDFRVRNTTRTAATINRVILEYKGMGGTMSGLRYSQPPIGPLDISDLNLGQLVEKDIAEVLEPGAASRFAVTVTSGWTDWGKTLGFRPSIKTSAGEVGHDDIEVYMAPVSDEEREMMKAVESGNLQQVKLLLQTNPSLHTIEPLTGGAGLDDVLYNAAGDEQIKIAALLLEKRPKPLDRRRTELALHMALERGNDRLVEVFLTHDVNVNSMQAIDPKCWRDVADDIMNGKTSDQPIETYVVSNKHRNCGSKGVTDGKNGVALLHKAAYYGHKGLVGLLLSKGANKSVRDADGEIPADYARRNNNEQIMPLLTD